MPKRPLEPGQVWAIRFFLDQHRRMRDRALFDLAISKLRGCDVVKMKIGDPVGGGRIRSRTIGVQRKAGRPVQFEIMADAQASLLAWLERRGGALDDHAFPSRSTTPTTSARNDMLDLLMSASPDRPATRGIRHPS